MQTTQQETRLIATKARTTSFNDDISILPIASNYLYFRNKSLVKEFYAREEHEEVVEQLRDMVTLMRLSKYHYAVFADIFQPIINSVILYIEQMDFDPDAPFSSNFYTMQDYEVYDADCSAQLLITHEEQQKCAMVAKDFLTTRRKEHLFFATKLPRPRTEFVDVELHLRKPTRQTTKETKVQTSCCIS